MANELILASSTDEAIKSKTSDSIYLAGGTEINRLNSYVDASTLISLKKIPELKGIFVKKDKLVIGSMTTFQELVESKDVPDYLKEVAHFMASRTKRNMATIGGNIAIMRSDSYIISSLMAACAKLILLDSNNKEEEICLRKYVGEYDNYKNMLIKCVIVDLGRSVYVKRFSNTAQSHAVLTIAFGHTNKDKLAVAASIKNVGNLDLLELAEKLQNTDLSEEEIVNYMYECKACNIPSDFFGSEKYKRYLLGVTISDMFKKAKEGK